MSLIEEPTVDIYDYSDSISLNLTNLLRDQYYIIFNNNHQTKTIRMDISNEECHNCPPISKLHFFPGLVDYEKYSSKYSEKWWIYADNALECTLEPDVGEFGVYELLFESCTLNKLVEPVNIGFPIIAVILIFLAAAIPVVGGIYAYDKFFKKNKDDEQEVKKNRVKSLDTFRGLSIIIMILVNYGGGGYNFLEHAIWNGLTIADLVFPWFLWIMGVCIPISIKSALKREDRYIFLHILKRAAILFLLGVLVNQIGLYMTPDGGQQMNIFNLRIFGVLQRFGLCYIVVASVCLIFMKKDFPETPGVFQDVIMMLPQFICGLLFVALNAGLTFGLEIPDCPVLGYLGPGGIQGDGNMSNYFKYLNCTGGAAGYIDRVVLGEPLMYRGGDFHKIYLSPDAVDPEGILGTCNAIFQVFLGVQAGITLLMYKGHSARVTRWVIWGVIYGLIGGGLCGFAREDGVIPINKNLWSLSFVLVTTFFALILLSILYLIVDGAGFWSGKPFIFAGMNSIILYVGQQLTYMRFPFNWGVLELNLHFQLLAQAVWGTMCWWLVSYWLYRIKFFLSI